MNSKKLKQVANDIEATVADTLYRSQDVIYELEDANQAELSRLENLYKYVYKLRIKAACSLQEKAFYNTYINRYDYILQTSQYAIGIDEPHFGWAAYVKTDLSKNGYLQEYVNSTNLDPTTLYSLPLNIRQGYCEWLSDNLRSLEADCHMDSFDTEEYAIDSYSAKEYISMVAAYVDQLKSK